MILKCLTISLLFSDGGSGVEDLFGRGGASFGGEGAGGLGGRGGGLLEGGGGLLEGGRGGTVEIYSSSAPP